MSIPLRKTLVRLFGGNRALYFVEITYHFMQWLLPWQGPR